MESLNDDCLYEIFSKDCLSIDDMIRIASSCKRFEKVAQQVFLAKFRQIDDAIEMRMWRANTFIKYLKHFGEICEALDARLFGRPQVVFGLIFKWCKNLKKLRCYDAGVSEVNQMQILCSTLLELENSGGYFDGRLLLAYNSPLQKLVLRKCEGFLPEIHLPELREIQLTATDLSQANFIACLRQNPQISRVDLADIYIDLENAIELMVNVVDFSYRDYETRILFTSYDCFANLRNVRQFRFRSLDTSSYMVLDALRRANSPLEKLILETFEMKMGAAEKICQFQGITELVLIENYFDSAYLSQILVNLPQLLHLYCESSRIQLGDIPQILQHVSHLESAIFNIGQCKIRDERRNVKAISKAARNRNTRIEIVISVNEVMVSEQSNIFLCEFRILTVAHSEILT